jgi:hypothetical protein
MNELDERKYYATVRILGVNDHDKVYFEKVFRPGYEVDDAIEFYEEIKRVLHFYDIRDDSEFFGAIWFGRNFDKVSMAPVMNLYGTHLYEAGIHFIRNVVSLYLNKRFCWEEKPLIAGKILSGNNSPSHNSVAVDESFNNLKQFVSLSNQYGRDLYLPTLVPPLEAYTERFNVKFSEVVKDWNDNFKKLQELEVFEHITYIDADREFVKKYIRVLMLWNPEEDNYDQDIILRGLLHEAVSSSNPLPRFKELFIWL